MSILDNKDSNSDRDVPRRLFTTLKQLLALEAITVPDVLAQASQLLAVAFQADKVDAFMHDAATASLFAMGVSETPMAERQRALGLDRLALANGGRVVEVFLGGGHYICCDVQADEVELLGMRVSLGIQSSLAVPLEVAGRRRGVLQVACCERDRFTLEDLGFLKVVSSWLGLTVHRVELIAESMRDAEHRGRQQAAEELLIVYAHDIRNHLMSISLRLTSLAHRAMRDIRQQDVSDIAKVRDIVRRLGEFAETQLSIERLRSGLFALSVVLVELGQLVRDTAELASAPDAPVQVLTPDFVEVEADPHAIRQALENVLSNARRFSPPGSPVVVSLKVESESTACISVRDFGPGIPADLVPRLFDRFVSGDRAGMGLGLYLARGLVEAHGGSLTVEHVIGSGACFCIRLPRQHRAPVQ